MANSDIVAARRDEIQQLWLRGVSVSNIAAQTNTPLGTVKHDLAVIRRMLAAQHAGDVRLARAALLASVRDVLQVVWQRYDAYLQRPPDACDERVLASYLGSVLKAHTLLGKLTGATAAPSELQQRVVDSELRTDEQRRWRQEELRRERERERVADDVDTTEVVTWEQVGEYLEFAYPDLFRLPGAAPVPPSAMPAAGADAMDAMDSELTTG
ncbi:MAG: hypothetical protein ACXVCX_03470 [Ktedonobacterales bacterium]